MLKNLVFLLFFLTLMVDNAYAYLDFGTGSYVLQILAASVIGVIFFIKKYLQAIKHFFIRKAPSDEDITEKSKGKE